jgi:hypothetical protein
VRTMAVAPTARVAVVVAMASALRCAAAQREGAIVGGWGSKIFFGVDAVQGIREGCTWGDGEMVGGQLA